MQVSAPQSEVGRAFLVRIRGDGNKNSRERAHKINKRTEQTTQIKMEKFTAAGLDKYFEESYGFAVFENVGKIGYVIGGGSGSGKVYCKIDGPDQPAKLVGKTNLVQLTAGFQLGVQIYSEIIFFETQRDFERFSNGNFEFEAGTQVTAITAGANAKASTAGTSVGASAGSKNACVNDPGYGRNGMAVFTITKGGLMYEATLGGQKFGYRPVSDIPVQ